MFLLYKNRVWMGKTRIAPNALKIEVESYDINLWRIPDQCADWLMWVHFGHPYSWVPLIPFLIIFFSFALQKLSTGARSNSQIGNSGKVEFRYGWTSKTRLALLEQQQNWIAEQIWTKIGIYHYLFIVFPMKRKLSVAEMNTIQIPFSNASCCIT